MCYIRYIEFGASLCDVYLIILDFGQQKDECIIINNNNTRSVLNDQQQQCSFSLAIWAWCVYVIMTWELVFFLLLLLFKIEHSFHVFAPLSDLSRTSLVYRRCAQFNFH